MLEAGERPSFAALRRMLREMPGPDEAAAAAVRARNAELTKPPGSLGRLEELAEWLAAWQGRVPPAVERPLVAIFAANHGVAARGVSAYPQAVTAQMVANFLAGGAAINQLCRAYDLGLQVYELALERPTPDIAAEDAFDEEECAGTIAYGAQAVAGGCDLLCLGEMGIANTTVAAAIYHALYGGEAGHWVGNGTGVDEAGLSRKAEAVAAGVARIGGEREPFEVMRRLGGREIAAMLGAIMAARQARVPVVIDGFVSTAAAALLHAADPDATAHCLFAHRSAEAAHGRVLERLGAAPLFDLGMRLGEGTGAALAAALLKGAVALHAGMATFAEAGVAGRGEG
jgi:nicotinate-nucleotide--dimethylbenzimidazole phosphoribosyltransferase